MSPRILVVLTAILFSTGGAAIKATDLSGIQVACLRSATAAVAICLVVPSARKGWDRRTVLVSFAFAATLILFVTSNKQTTAANAIFLQQTSPIYLLLISPVVLREPLKRLDIMTVVVMLGGVALFFLDDPAGSATAPNPVLGNVLSLASGVGWALTVAGLRWIGRASGTNAAAAATVSGNALAAVVTAPFAFPLSGASPRDAAVVLYLGVFQIALAYALLTRAVPRLAALDVSLLLFVEPALSPIWAWLVHGERPGAWAILGAALILVATASWSIADHRRRAPQPLSPLPP